MSSKPTYEQLQDRIVHLEGLVSELQTSERTVRLCEQRYKKIYENLQDVYYESSLEGTILEVSPSIEKFSMYKREELIGKSLYEFYPDGKERDLFVELIIKDGSVYDYEIHLRDKDGSLHLCSITTVLLRNQEGMPEKLIGSIRDISERKQAEQSLRQVKEWAETILHTIQSGVFVIEAQSHIIMDVNRAAEEMIGADREEIVGNICHTFVCPKALGECPITDRGRDIHDDETILLRKDGGQTEVIKTVNSVIINECKYLIESFVDISGRKQAEKEKSHIEEQYRQAQKVEAIGRLAGGVAHDLNNILSPIIGFGELLIEDISQEDLRRESVEHIIQAGYRARDLVRQLLAFGRKQTLEYRTIDLNKAISEFKSLLRRTIREDINIEFIPASNTRSITADIGQIEQVIMNLCVNAQDAMPEGGKLQLMTNIVEIDQVTASSTPGTRPGSYILLSVSDTGCGIDHETQKQIFEPFFSTKGEKGTGLGLSTVYGIVKQHSGNVWVESEVGKGSTFKVYFPVSEKTASGKEVVGMVPDELKGDETILLVEDNEQVLRLSNTILKRKGYKTLVARNGAEALTIIESHDGVVDLVLTDVIMPDINGKDLFGIISDKHPEVGVLYMSGYADDVIARHGVLETGTHFIQKPFSIEALSMKVRQVLDSSKDYADIVELKQT